MNKAQDEYFLRKAIELGRQGMKANQGGPFGAVIVKSGEIVGQGYNQVTSSKDPTAHAEIVAIRDTCQKLGEAQLTDCVLYTSCEPCPMCLGAIYWARMMRMVFAASRKDAAAAGFDDDFIYRELVLPLPERAIPIEQGLSELAVALFQEWREKEDKVKY